MGGSPVAALFRQPIVYDVILGDFGRIAALRYLEKVTLKEQEIIAEILAPHQLEFFDEYRRTMFALLAEVEFFKRDAIAREQQATGALSQRVLIGLGPDDYFQETAARMTFSVVHSLLAAEAKGYRRFRVAIPCNGLSDLAKKISDHLRSPSELAKMAAKFSSSKVSLDAVSGWDVTVKTVPEMVVRHIGREIETNKARVVLVLGTRGVNNLYRPLLFGKGLDIIELSDYDYSVLDEAIVAAIGRDAVKTEHARGKLRDLIIEPRQAKYPDLVIVEGCTDFEFNLGLSSLDLFASEMMHECYSPFLERPP